MFSILQKASRNWINKASSFFRRIDQSSREKIRMIRQNPNLGSELFKRFLQVMNNVVMIARRQWPNHRVRITVGLFGLVIGYTVHRSGDLRNVFSKPPEEHLEDSQKELITKLAPVLSDFINKNVLKSEQIQEQLAKLIYSICISNHIVHITAQNLNKVVRMDQVSNFTVELTKQQLTQNLFKNIAQEKFRQVLILILKMDHVRDFLQEKSLEYIGGETFQKLTNEQLRNLLHSPAFQREVTKIVKEMIKSSLNNPQSKRYIYNRIKARFM